MNENLTTNRTPEVIAAEIRTFTAAALNNILEIGRRMCEVKELIPYGEFGTWVKENTGYSQSSANNFMRLFNEYGSSQGSLFGAFSDSQSIGKLSYTKALALLAVPAKEREEFAEKTHAEELSVSELKKAIKEREEALKERDNALSAFKKNEDKWAEANIRNAAYEKKFGEYEYKICKKEEEMERLREEHEIAEIKLRNEATHLKEEIEKLESRPVEVAVERDEKAIRQAVDEANAKSIEERRNLEEKLKKTEKERQAAADKFSKLLKEAEKALEDTKAKKLKAEEEAKKASAEVEKLKKSSEAKHDSTYTEFSIIFKRVQEELNELVNLRNKAKGADNTELSDKFTAAIKALFERYAKEME